MPDYPIDANLEYNIALANADEAWRRFLASSGLAADVAEAEKERAQKVFKAKEAEDIQKLHQNLGGRGIFFSGLTAKGTGKIQSEYMDAWAGFLNDLANKYINMAQQGWGTNAEITQNIVKSALDYLRNIERIYTGSV